MPKVLRARCRESESGGSVLCRGRNAQRNQNGK